MRRAASSAPAPSAVAYVDHTDALTKPVSRSSSWIRRLFLGGACLRPSGAPVWTDDAIPAAGLPRAPPSTGAPPPPAAPFGPSGLGSTASRFGLADGSGSALTSVAGMP
eukprot:scaffold13836_cov73-Isochrysis_galbana.AAC.2